MNITLNLTDEQTQNILARSGDNEFTSRDSRHDVAQFRNNSGSTATVYLTGSRIVRLMEDDTVHLGIFSGEISGSDTKLDAGEFNTFDGFQIG